MRHLLPFALCLSVLAAASAAPTGAARGAMTKNGNGAWTTHYAGPHDGTENTCDFGITDCVSQLDVAGPAGPGRFDVYIIATDVAGIASTRFGLPCSGGFSFYGWAGCADSETPESGWPACGKGITLSWTSEQMGPYVTLGVLDLYVYGTSTFCSGPDPRLGSAEFCDGTMPTPICVQLNDSWRFGCVGFGRQGYATCPSPDQSQEHTWGIIKSLYRD
jgi:hypothetical protein